MTAYDWVQIASIAVMFVGNLIAVAAKRPDIGMAFSGGWLIAWSVLVARVYMA